MKCRYTFRIESSLALDPAIGFAFEGRHFNFVADEKGRLVAVRVEVDNYPQELWPTFGQKGEGMPTLKIPADLHLVSALLDLQAARGALSLWGVHDIETDYPEIHWIPESEAEKRGLEVSHYNIRRGDVTQQLVSGPLDMLVRCVLSAKKFAGYEIPLDFYRRSLEDMRKERYIEAIYDLWFILEYLFGGGVYSKDGVERSFQQDERLSQSLDAVRASWEDELARHEEDWNKIKTRYVNRTNQEIIKNLVKMRGFLHHQSLKRKMNWSPMRQREYRVDAVFLRWLCQDVLMKVSCDILFERTAMEEFKSTHVTDPMGRTINWRPYP